jgi:hypothetical protein
MPLLELERKPEHIGSIWSRVTCLAVPLVAAQSLNVELLEILKVIGA